MLPITLTHNIRGECWWYDSRCWTFLPKTDFYRQQLSGSLASDMNTELDFYIQNNALNFYNKISYIHFNFSFKKLLFDQIEHFQSNFQNHVSRFSQTAQNNFSVLFRNISRAILSEGRESQNNQLAGFCTHCHSYTWKLLIYFYLS